MTLAFNAYTYKVAGRRAARRLKHRPGEKPTAHGVHSARARRKLRGVAEPAQQTAPKIDSTQQSAPASRGTARPERTFAHEPLINQDVHTALTARCAAISAVSEAGKIAPAVCRSSRASTGRVQ